MNSSAADAPIKLIFLFLLPPKKIKNKNSAKTHNKTKQQKPQYKPTTQQKQQNSKHNIEQNQ
jgi:hypothetical protein